MSISNTEKWRAIKGCPGYEVSNQGRVRSLDKAIVCHDGTIKHKKGKILKLYENRKRGGYLNITIPDGNGECHQFKVHRLVAQAFIPNPENKPFINHIDCNPKNNTVSNLEWVTAQENVDWMIECGRRRIANERPVIGTNLKTGERLFFRSIMEASRHGFDRPTLRKAIHGEFRHHKGFAWEYA